MSHLIKKCDPLTVTRAIALYIVCCTYLHYTCPDGRILCNFDRVAVHVKNGRIIVHIDKSDVDKGLRCQGRCAPIPCPDSEDILFHTLVVQRSTHENHSSFGVDSKMIVTVSSDNVICDVGIYPDILGCSKYSSDFSGNGGKLNSKQKGFDR